MLNEIRKSIKWYVTLLFSCKVILLREIKVNCLDNLRFHNSNYEVRRLSKDLIYELMSFHDGNCLNNVLFSMEDVIRRMKEKHICYVATKNESVVGFAWFGKERVFSPDLELTFLVPNNCLIGYNNFVHPKYQGKRILSDIRIVAFKDFMSNGIDSVYSYILSNNLPSIHSGDKFSEQTVGKIFTGYAFFYHYCFVRFSQKSSLRILKNFDSWGKIGSFFRVLSSIKIRS